MTSSLKILTEVLPRVKFETVLDVLPWVEYGRHFKEKQQMFQESRDGLKALSASRKSLPSVT